MGKERYVLLALLLLAAFAYFSALASAQSEDDVASKAMQCLSDLLSERDSISLQEAVFASLAGATDGKIPITINSTKSQTEECWPAGGCTVRDTAQVMITKIRNGEDVEGIKEWLLSKVGPAQGLTWYLEITIPSRQEATCRVRAEDPQTGDASEARITVHEDLTLSGNTGACFTLANSNYWLMINQNCLDKVFKIACDNQDDDFITNLAYQREGGGVVFISPVSHSGTGSSDASSFTTEEVKAKCFKQGNACDYEGSLWATLALNYYAQDVSEFTPYLHALAEDNVRYLPYAFVYLIDGRDDDFTRMLSFISRFEGRFVWDVPNTAYNRFYDTALALLAMGQRDSGLRGSVISELADLQGDNGCWNNNNLRDTAFLIFGAGWTFGNGGGGPSVETHSECSPDGACVTVQGAGQDMCSADSDCANVSSGNHSACNSQGQCIVVQGPGQDQCSTDADCSSGGHGGSGGGGGGGGQSHAVCNTQDQCVQVQGPGQDQCSTDADCPAPPATHKVCSISGQCIPVSGDGADECSTDSDCTLPPFPFPGGNFGGGPGAGGENGTDTTDTGGFEVVPPECEASGFYCVSSRVACIENGGQAYAPDELACDGLNYCCSVQVEESQAQDNCADIGGQVCPTDTQCSMSVVPAADTAECCIGTCLTTQTDSSSGTDTTGQQEQVAEGGSSLLIWIIVLIIMIIFVVVGIIYRDKIRFMIYKWQGKAKSKGVGPGKPGPPGVGAVRGPLTRLPPGVRPRVPGPRPGMPMRGLPGRTMPRPPLLGPRPGQPPGARPAAAQTQAQQEKKQAEKKRTPKDEHEETLKKLKEIAEGK